MCSHNQPGKIPNPPSFVDDGLLQGFEGVLKKMDEGSRKDDTGPKVFPDEENDTGYSYCAKCRGDRGERYS